MTATHPSERRAQRLAARPARMRALRRGALVALPLAGVFAFATYHTATPDPASPFAARTTGSAQEEAALFGSPAHGTTGTIALPPVPRGAVYAGDAGVTPARPFSTRFASTLDRARALECLTAAVYYEAASESDAGERAVAQVVLNRVRHPAFPPTVCGVVYQGAARRTGCQFSFACDGSTARAPSRTEWARAARNAAFILSGGVFAPVGLATHYHTYAVTPAWNRTLVMTDAIGAHFFHRWKGYWGTAIAFNRVYRGGEPQPAMPASPLTDVPPAAFTVPAPATAAAAAPQIENGAAPRDAAPDTLPQSQILDRWKDSGKPLR